MGSLSFVMYFSKFIIHQSVLYVILFFQKTCKVVYIYEIKKKYKYYINKKVKKNML